MHRVYYIILINVIPNIGSGQWGFNHRAPGKYEIASQNLGVKYIVLRPIDYDVKVTYFS